MTAPTKPPNLTMLRLDKIKLNGGTQARAEVNQECVDAYAAAVHDKAKFPPVVVFFDGTDYWPGDGFHRILSHIEAKVKVILAEIRQGTRRDAILHSVGANSEHGLQRSQADKRVAIKMLLEDDEWRKWSDREIGRQCRVDHKTVASVRQELSGEIPTERTAQRGGTVYTMDTGKAAGMVPPDLEEAFRLLPKAEQKRLLREAQGEGKPAKEEKGRGAWVTCEACDGKGKVRA